MAKKQMTEDELEEQDSAPEGGALVNWEERLLAEAKDVAAVERPSVGNLSFRSGILSYDGNEVDGGKLNCIIVASAFENRWYKGAWDPDNIEAPDCFAIGLAEDGKVPAMAPHANVVNPVSEVCKGCKLNEWGSDTSRPGSRGKACKEIRRLALIPYSGDMTAESITGAEVALAKIPVTSVKNWANYVNMVGAKHKRPPWAVGTTISCKSHVKWQLEVNFDFMVPMPTELLGALDAKRQSVLPALMVPYEGKAEQEEVADSDKY